MKDLEVDVVAKGPGKPKKGVYREYYGAWIPVTSTRRGLSAGEWKTRMYADEVGFIPVTRSGDDLVDVPQPEMQRMMSDVDKFLASGERYRAAGLVHKRGYLLYGPPGTGKSCLVARLSRRIVERGGLVVHAGARGFTGAVDSIKQGETDRLTLFAMEEIDAWNLDQDLLSALDGDASPGNAVFVATTNHKESLPARIVNRPGRFDRVIKIGFPHKEARVAYAEYMYRRLGSRPSDKDCHRMIELTKGRSLAHLKEMIVAVMIMDDTPDEVHRRFGSSGPLAEAERAVDILGLRSGAEDPFDEDKTPNNAPE